MDEYRRYKRINRRRRAAIVVIAIFAFLIIFVSALITKGASKKKENAGTSVAKAESQKNVTTEEEANATKEPEVKEADVVIPGKETTSQVASSKTQNITNTTNNSNAKNDAKVQNSVSNTNTTKTNNSKKATTASKGKIPVANPDAVDLCKQAQTGHEKNIYLTFDDGPSPEVTPQVLATLKEYDVLATFFVLGSRVELYPELVKQEYDEGHFIANHGYTHTYSAIYSSVQSVIDEYNKCDKAVQDALGTTEYHTLLFRFPGGSSGGPYNNLKAEAKRTLENMGVPSTNWNCLNGDAEGGKRTKQQLINRLYETAEGWDSLVVLMHDANDKQTTADALPEIIEHYKAEGYTFKNYYEIFQ